MTIVLVAVYVPIGFQGGLTGALFTEFAFTLAGAVTVSGIVALTLSPMMTSRFFRAEQESGRFVRFIDRQFDRLQRGYQRAAARHAGHLGGTVVMGVILLGGRRLPVHDVEVRAGAAGGPGHRAGADHRPAERDAAADAGLLEAGVRHRQELPEYDQMFQITGVPTVNQGIGGVLFKPWDERSTQRRRSCSRSCSRSGTASPARASRRSSSRRCPARTACRCSSSSRPPSRSRASTRSRRRCSTKAQASGMFFFVDTDLKVDKPQTTVEVDRDLVATLGLTQQDVGAALGAALGGGYVNYFSIAGRSYKVIPQVLQADRLNPGQVLDYHIRTADGSLVSGVDGRARRRPQVVPEGHQPLPAAQFGDDLRRVAPAVSQNAGARLHAQRRCSEVAPSGYSSTTRAVSRQFVQESGGFVVTLLFAVIIVFLALAAQFESFRDPVVILVSVPMALFGALIFINLGFATLNIYTAGRAGHADGADQQARHPDRAVRQSAAARPARASARRSKRPRRCGCARS